MKHRDSQVSMESWQHTRELKHGTNFGYSIINMTFLGCALETLMKSQDTQKKYEVITEAKLKCNFSGM